MKPIAFDKTTKRGKVALLPLVTDSLGQPTGRELYRPGMTTLALEYGWKNINKDWCLTEVDTIKVEGELRMSRRIHTLTKGRYFKTSTLLDGTRILQIVITPMSE